MSNSVDDILNLSYFLPTFEEISLYVQQEPEANCILRKALENIKKIQENRNEINGSNIEECNYLIQCLSDKFWERIHTGHFSEVQLTTRKIYAIANYFKIFYLILESVNTSQIEKCSAILDDAMLVGSTQNLYTRNDELQRQLFQLFDKLTGSSEFHSHLPIIEPIERIQSKSDIPIYDCPTVMDFKKCCFDALQPALLLNTISHWPALVKWRDLNYINKMAGSRCVPIEIGSNYTSDEWSQQIVKIRDFLQRQFSAQKKSAEDEIELEYLAQHELFDQIPTLKEDIVIPDYCSLGTNLNPPDIKAWLGPKGTISPMHYDPKHNLLCQIFGSKSIILASPQDTACLYPHETDFLKNTSKIDAANLDFQQFPLTAKVRFYKLLLQSGDCLYMPPQWWHYVQSESPSFSVSFWWE